MHKSSAWHPASPFSWILRFIALEFGYIYRNAVPTTMPGMPRSLLSLERLESTTARAPWRVANAVLRSPIVCRALLTSRTNSCRQ